MKERKGVFLNDLDAGGFTVKLTRFIPGLNWRFGESIIADLTGDSALSPGLDWRPHYNLVYLLRSETARTVEERLVRMKSPESL